MTKTLLYVFSSLLDRGFLKKRRLITAAFGKLYKKMQKAITARKQLQVLILEKSKKLGN